MYVASLQMNIQEVTPPGSLEDWSTKFLWVVFQGPTQSSTVNKVICT